LKDAILDKYESSNGKEKIIGGDSSCTVKSDVIFLVVSKKNSDYFCIFF